MYKHCAYLNKNLFEENSTKIFTKSIAEMKKMRIFAPESYCETF